MGSAELAQGEKLVAEGKLDAAAGAFRAGMKSNLVEIRDQAFLRMCGTMLKTPDPESLPDS
ncbi:MAG TPA: hypothetical protein PLP17_08120, partial [Oligoflexia bacterium]|nr:hypothetical protein [Oligoflexia bacterium]